MLKKIITTILAFATLGLKPNTEYVTYCNARFDFCIQYPQNFTKGKEPTNDDGLSFTSKDKKTKITAWGNLAIEDFDKLTQQFDIDTFDIKISYKTIKSNWFVFSGVDKKGNIVYQKTVKKKIAYMGDTKPDTYVFQNLQITYPPNQADIYNSYCVLIAKSFKE